MTKRAPTATTLDRRVGGCAADASIATGSALAPDDRAADASIATGSAIAPDDLAADAVIVIGSALAPDDRAADAVIVIGSALAPDDRAANAVIVIGSALAPDDRAANHHRVGGGAANPTSFNFLQHAGFLRSALGFCILHRFSSASSQVDGDQGAWSIKYHHTAALNEP